MSKSQRFIFTEKPDTFGVIDTVPQLSFTLINGNNSVEASGLLDTGASVNVLPYPSSRYIQYALCRQQLE